MKTIITIIILATTVLNIKFSFAQDIKNTIVTMRVGASVPKEFWDQKIKVYNQGDTAIVELSKYKGKSLLIDFWATWCSSCVNGFPKLLDIQNKFSDKINILLVNSKVTRDDYSKIHLMKSDILRKNNLTTIYNDTYLTNLIPHVYIPYYVWINPNGKITAISFSEFVNVEQVKAFIDYNTKYESLN